MDEEPLGVRAEFPITKDLAYLNRSAVAPIPRAVREAGIEYLDGKRKRASAARNSERKEHFINESDVQRLLSVIATIA
jgi:hypothetical protein